MKVKTYNHVVSITCGQCVGLVRKILVLLLLLRIQLQVLAQAPEATENLTAVSGEDSGEPSNFPLVYSDDKQLSEYNFSG